VESADPRLGLHAAVTTSDPDGQPAAGYRPAERLSIAEALRGFTSDAAYAAGVEAELGRLEVGQRADLVVWDRDLLHANPRDLLAAKPVMTVVDGR
jgi:predicted amidohydrolase YtcJ